MYLKILSDLTLKPIQRDLTQEELFEIDEGVATVVKYDHVRVCWREAQVTKREDGTFELFGWQQL